MKNISSAMPCFYAQFKYILNIFYNTISITLIVAKMQIVASEWDIK